MDGSEIYIDSILLENLWKKLTNTVPKAERSPVKKDEKFEDEGGGSHDDSRVCLAFNCYVTIYFRWMTIPVTSAELLEMHLLQLRRFLISLFAM